MQGQESRRIWCIERRYDTIDTSGIEVHRQRSHYHPTGHGNEKDDLFPVLRRERQKQIRSVHEGKKHETHVTRKLVPIIYLPEFLRENRDRNQIQSDE